MSTPPLSSSSSSASSPSPSIDHSPLNPDESLEILLKAINNVNGTSEPAEPTTSSEWEQLSAWAHTEGAKLPDFNDFNFSLPMDLDFDPTMAVDPNALHFNTSIFDTDAMGLPSDSAFLMPQGNVTGDLLYPNTDDMSWMSHIQPETGRRLSITSSSSSSGASLSPISEHASVSSSPPSDIYLNDPAQELAHKVRQMAGVTLAVPVSAQVQQMAPARRSSQAPNSASPSTCPAYHHQILPQILSQSISLS